MGVGGWQEFKKSVLENFTKGTRQSWTTALDVFNFPSGWHLPSNVKSFT